MLSETSKKSYFPKELYHLFYNFTHDDKKYPKEVSFEAIENDIGNFFKMQEPVRRAFINWANDHTKITEDTFILYTAKRIADQHPLQHNHNRNNHFSLKRDIIDNNLTSAFGLYTLKIINSDQYKELSNETISLLQKTYTGINNSNIINYLSERRGYTGSTLLHDNRFFPATIPLLDVLKPDELMKVFSSIGIYRNTPLHCRENAIAAMPLLKKLNPVQFDELCMKKNMKELDIYKYCYPHPQSNSKEDNSKCLHLLNEILVHKLEMLPEHLKDNEPELHDLPEEVPNTTQTSIQLLKNCAKEIFDIHHT